jgi:hypothetical protein
MTSAGSWRSCLSHLNKNTAQFLYPGLDFEGNVPDDIMKALAVRNARFVAPLSINKCNGLSASSS